MDCINGMKLLDDNSIDLTVTSPPYDNLRTYGKNVDKTWGEHIWKPVIKELYRIIKKGGVVVWIVNDATINGSETGTSFKQALYFKEVGFNLHDTMIYAKNNPIPLTHNRYEQQFEYMFVFSKGKPKTFNPIKINTKYSGSKKTGGFRQNRNGEYARNKNAPVCKSKIDYNIWWFDVGNGHSTNSIKSKHPATYSIEIPNRHIISWSNENDIVLDPFIGSGTTAISALQNNRKYIGFEINREYVELANEIIKTQTCSITL